MNSIGTNGSDKRQAKSLQSYWRRNRWPFFLQAPCWLFTLFFFFWRGREGSYNFWKHLLLQTFPCRSKEWLQRVTGQCVTKDQQTFVRSENATIFTTRVLIMPQGEPWKLHFIHNTERIKSSEVPHLYFHLVFGVIGMEVLEHTFKDNISSWQCSM